MRLLRIAIVLSIVLVWSCKKDNVEDLLPPPPDTSVHFEIDQVPYAKLSDYRFFVGDLKNMEPNDRVLPYEPITPLFSDYAHKKRFVWMMPDSSANYVNDSSLLDFPNGTVFIKNFYYDNVQPTLTRKILETRLLIKRNDEWIFADYVWNEDQTEAYADLNGSYQQVDWIHDDGNPKSTTFRIPSEPECHTCHKSNNLNTPIIPKPQHLNKSYTYADGAMNQLQKWQSVGYLTGNIPANVYSVVDWTDDTQSLELRVRSYLDANCAHCHSDGGHCYYRPIRLAFNMTDDPNNLGVCVTPQQMITPQLAHIIARGNINKSVMYFRMNTNDPQYMMPLMGRTMVHQEAVDLLEQYINSLSPLCN
jgi:uncharacterized repeat protein (TIGR03806 family)